jgi:hypothetical protein
MSSIQRALRAANRFLHPDKPGGASGVLYAVMCAVLLLLFGARQTGLMPDAASIIGGLGGPPYAAPASVFHLTQNRWIVHSRYDWDSGVLDSTAVDDVDYGVPEWTHEPARLPGPSWVTYRYLGSGYIAGSGEYFTVQAPNGGHLTYFHLIYAAYTLPLHGGQQIGATGWPTSAEYSGGGPADGSNAHLCVAYDAAGRAWVQYLASNPRNPNAPKPFHHRIWGQYRAEHHLKPIAWHNRKGHIYYAAAVWNHHDPKVVGGIVNVHRYKARVPYTVYRFQGMKLFVWRAKGYHPKWVHEGWKR